MVEVIVEEPAGNVEPPGSPLEAQVLIELGLVENEPDFGFNLAGSTPV